MEKRKKVLFEKSGSEKKGTDYLQKTRRLKHELGWITGEVADGKRVKCWSRWVKKVKWLIKEGEKGKGKLGWITGKVAEGNRVKCK